MSSQWRSRPSALRDSPSPRAASGLGAEPPVGAAPAGRPEAEDRRGVHREDQGAPADPRITTELVDHLPASDTVPTPLKFFGRIVGTPGELTYAKDIYRYYDALDKASDRVKVWRIGKTEEGRDMVLLAVADEATIKQLDKYKGMIAALTDPRKTTEAQAQQLIATAKPIYWITSGMHSTETGGPEMLIELAYRLAVEETPFIQQIRNNVITFITPVIEVDGREKQVDTYYFNKKRRARRSAAAAADVLGQVRRARQQPRRHGAVPRADAQRHEDVPRLEADDHARPARAQTYLYASTGTGPYNEQIDPITDRRVVAAGEDRSDGDDQARRARRVDLRVLRRLGAELHVLHRARAQRDRPLLRGHELRARTTATVRRRRRPAASGSGRTRRCRRSSGDRATTPTSSSRRS